MTWTARFLALSFLAALYSPCLFAHIPKSPWSSIELENAFINAFLNELGKTGDFSQRKLQAMTTIGDAFKMLADKLMSSGKSSASNMEALNKAFASSVAEIAVGRKGRKREEITADISGALSRAFLQSTGAVNTQFVHEISRLINPPECKD
ncbi:major ampullate spidroin 1A variant 4 [Trichonephila inaurata madagascariensis]|uniref:Major ampullate spidroin 1A variant 4 n=1 Tax=Trichonephila inaurata madagascariensis TaxID=2747483 RepID=A0A8X6KQD8_9ARAC|nr:major ampullate spidroin 1A variant 4 [Trichonephila inaurata madagascariensis]